MKKTKALVDKLVEEIEKTPLVQVACDKVGISRNTFYRWMKEDRNFLSRVNEAMSLGTGLVNDVALSNVLEGIKKKDVMYTKYWLSHKHPDFRRPFVFKIDSDDLISHFRSTMEGVRLRQIEQDIRHTATEDEERRREKAKIEVQKWMNGWEDVMKRDREKRAQELFEEWKKDYESKPTGSRKPPSRRR